MFSPLTQNLCHGHTFSMKLSISSTFTGKYKTDFYSIKIGVLIKSNGCNVERDMLLVRLTLTPLNSK